MYTNNSTNRDITNWVQKERKKERKKEFQH